ncbi:MAG: hypothetical protein KDA47_21480, partial [Planctomycetales bacterium]|nr:hypothetical protein [Planctomycetales bacterium]
MQFAHGVLAGPQVVELIRAVRIRLRGGDHVATGVQQFDRHARQQFLARIEFAILIRIGVDDASDTAAPEAAAAPPAEAPASPAPAPAPATPVAVDAPAMEVIPEGTSFKSQTVREALRDAMSEEMRRDENVYLMGEEVAEYQGAYKISQGMLDEFGAKRVIDTPITEHGFT